MATLKNIAMQPTPSIYIVFWKDEIFSDTAGCCLVAPSLDSWFDPEIGSSL